ncbi:unnamed protein product [Caenorhabditis auriculariae]|uniref:ERCC4 domain-containing protein n=1 Tax=Caenorhabditis auriculariae TaxID=2777116 RepID=A0A8S1GTX6_9PELO|nr:unnamed protein product [Caenorhabditis auriculariae]
MDEILTLSSDEEDEPTSCKKKDDDDDIVCIEETSMISPAAKTTSSASKRLERSPVDPKYNFLDLDDEVDDGDLKSTLDELDRLIAKGDRKRKSETASTSHLRSSSPLQLSDEDDELEILDSQPFLKKKKTEDVLGKNDKGRKILEKATKEIEKKKKQEEARRKKEEKEREKESRKIEREMSASLNSKCEQYTYCHVGRAVLDAIDDLEVQARLLFSERNIEGQFLVDESIGMRIEWHRKCVELREDDDGRRHRLEYKVAQDLFAVVVPCETLKTLIESKGIVDFVVKEKEKFSKGQSSLIIVCYGKLNIKKKKLHPTVLDLFENHKTQLYEAPDPGVVALMMAQFLRSLARREKRRTEKSMNEKRFQYIGDKGLISDDRDEMVKDWWVKMLNTIDRISDAQRRAIIKFIPDPIAASKKYSKMDIDKAIQEISNIVAENNRRVGPAMAHRLLMMLTDETGNEVIE